MKQLALLDIDCDSPRVLKPENMSNELAKLLVENLILGDFRMTPWQDDFLGDVQPLTTFTLPQKQVIYNLAFKFHIL